MAEETPYVPTPDQKSITAVNPKHDTSFSAPVSDDERRRELEWLRTNYGTDHATEMKPGDHWAIRMPNGETVLLLCDHTGQSHIWRVAQKLM